MMTALGDSGFADTSTASKVRELQNAIWQIESAEPWPFLEASIDLNFDGSSPIPTNLPTRIRALLKARNLSTGQRVVPIRLDDLQDQLGDSAHEATVGNPTVYYFEGANLKFWPVPPASTGLVRTKYIQHSAAITSTSPESAILIPVRWHDLIVVKTLGKLYRIEDDLELAQYCEADAQQQLAAMKSDVFKQQYDQPDFIRVFDVDSWDYDF